MLCRLVPWRQCRISRLKAAFSFPLAPFFVWLTLKLKKIRKQWLFFWWVMSDDARSAIARSLSVKPQSQQLTLGAKILEDGSCGGQGELMRIWYTWIHLDDLGLIMICSTIYEFDWICNYKANLIADGCNPIEMEPLHSRADFPSGRPGCGGGLWQWCLGKGGAPWQKSVMIWDGYGVPSQLWLVLCLLPRSLTAIGCYRRKVWIIV